MIRAIFWDNDGVLVDTERLYFQANAEILAKQGIELTLDLFRRHWLFESQGLFALAELHRWEDGLFASMRSERDARYSELLTVGDLVLPEVRDILAAIPKTVTQAIVTSSKRSHFDVIHSRSELLPHFNFVLAAGDYKNSKPDPEPYLLALERAGVAPDEALVIEDSERGLRAAVGAGIPCWVLPSELTLKSDFSSAARVMRSLREVLEAF